MSAQYLMPVSLIASPLSTLLGIRFPILLAPMAGVAGGALAAAVSRAGGLGLIGGGYGDRDWLEREWLTAGGAAVGVGFITWRLADAADVLARALQHSPPAVLLSFGPVAPYVDAVHGVGALLIAQVQTVAQARAAAAAGADIIVAQGAESGGHGGQRGTLALVPAVVDAVAPLPVVAAGGIADGRGIAAALTLGASGAMLGSRFYASNEALVAPGLKARARAASGDATVRSRVFDRLRGWEWPAPYQLRTLANDTTRRYADDPAAFEQALRAERGRFDRAMQAGDPERGAVIVGENADLITTVEPAAAIVARLMAETVSELRRAAGLIIPTD